MNVPEVTTEDPPTNYVRRSFGLVLAAAPFLRDRGESDWDYFGSVTMHCVMRCVRYASHMAPAMPKIPPTTATPNQDLNLLNFEQLKWAGVRHTRPIYQLFDLTQFEKLPAVEATKEDLKILRSILAAASSIPNDAWCSELEKSISCVFPSSKSERRILLQILSYSGIISPHERPGFFREWPTVLQREDRPSSKIDWTYPIMWWQGRDGVSYEAVDYYFPNLRKRPNMA